MKILLVSDNALLNCFIRTHLRSQGHDIKCITSYYSVQPIEWLTSNSCDVVIFRPDNMPQAEERFSSILVQFPSLPILLYGNVICDDRRLYREPLLWTETGEAGFIAAETTPHELEERILSELAKVNGVTPTR